MIVEAIEIKKVFSGRKIFSDINFKLENKSALAITGRNGSGKSTLVKIIADVLSPTSGVIKLNVDGSEIPTGKRYRHIGFVSPYLQLYEEFSALENLELFAKVRGLKIENDVFNDLLKRINLYERRNDLVRTFSSGMKQRLKYAFALIHQPPLLILDEPRTNLDVEGISVVSEIINNQKQNGIVIIATNDSDDIPYCNQIIDLNYRSK